MHRIALIVVLLILSQGASAYTASSAYQVAPCYGGSVLGGYASAAAACGALNSNSVAVTCFGGTSWALTAPTSGACVGTVQQPPYAPNTNASGGTYSASGYTCPNGGTLSGTTCTCGAGYTDSGTACVANTCPSIGTDLGYQNLTTGWALSPVVGATDIIGGTINYGAIYGGSHCVPESGSMCGATLSTDTDPQNCWRSQAPSDQGLYRLSCDFKMVSSGANCTSSGGTPSSPAAGGPTCPTGNVGEVNGKPVCLGSVPTSGVDFGGGAQSGNPRAGTSPTENTNAEREPTAGSGGAPDARGGPDVTTGPGGSGTGNNRVGSGSGKGDAGKIEFPTDYNREATQQSVLSELKKARKIDETGTPNGDGADSDAKTAVDGEATKLSTSLSGIVAGDGAPDRSWGMSISFPSTCTPFVVGTANWGFFNVDFCDFQDVAHDLMTLVWLAATIFVCVGMVFRAINAG